MSREVKYTSDNKKVVVIGNLNSQEKIVQEIFVADGSEIPSGEHFVVKSLHNEPVISWKEQRLKEVEARYELDIKKYESEIDNLRKSHSRAAAELRAKIAYMGSVLKNVNEKSFETLVDYLTGEIKWVVVRHYDLELLPIHKFQQTYDGHLRLVSLFGKDDGTFTYAMGDYDDYSGGNKKFIPFKNYEDALAELKRLAIESNVSEKIIKLAQEYGFELPAEKVSSWKAQQVLNFNKCIASHESKIEEWKQSIERLSNETPK